MPMNRALYPANWDQIAQAIKEQSYWKCQQCGKQCRRPGEPLDTHRRTLTVAHINHVSQDVRPENLVALCAPCHLDYDRRRRRLQRLARLRINEHQARRRIDEPDKQCPEPDKE